MTNSTDDDETLVIGEADETPTLGHSVLSFFSPHSAPPRSATAHSASARSATPALRALAGERAGRNRDWWTADLWNHL